MLFSFTLEDVTMFLKYINYSESCKVKSDQVNMVTY